MSNFMLSIVGSFTLLITACAVDAAGADRPPDGSAAAIEQATTVLDDCAVGHAANAFEDAALASPQSYTRKGDPMINFTCDCKAWQQDANANGTAQADLDHPLCRSNTFVNVQWENAVGAIPQYTVEVPSWSLTNGDIECKNSTLAVSLWKLDSTNTWVKQGPTVTKSPTVNSNGVCSSVQIQDVAGSTGELYRIHAIATRGHDDNNHGFETVKISANVGIQLPFP